MTIPPEHPEQLVSSIEFQINVITITFADESKTYRLQIMYGDDILTIGTLRTSAAAFEYAHALKLLFEGLLRSDWGDHAEFTDMTATAQALLDIRKDQWRAL